MRTLFDSTGAVTDTYVYDAWGKLVPADSSTPTGNHYRYTGEQWDADLGFYHNRARYLNANTGRFWNMDPFEGNQSDPQSLHKYLYAHANPVNNVDPSGLETGTLTEKNVVVAINTSMNSVRLAKFVNRVKKIRDMLCKPIDNMLWQAHHLIPLFMGGPGSRPGTRDADRSSGLTIDLGKDAHTALHSLISLLLNFSGMPHGSMSSADFKKALSARQQNSEDAMQVLIWSAIFTDHTCAKAPGYNLMKDKLINGIRKEGYKVNGIMVEGSTISL